MSKSNDFGKAALAAYKKRHARDEKLGFFSAGSPLVKAAKADPDSLAIDVDWLDKTIMSIPELKRPSLGVVARIAASCMRGGDTETNRIIALYRFLKRAEARGHLSKFQQEPTTAPPSEGQ